MIILGIETSCDETAASIIEGKQDNIKVLSNVVSSQIEIHKKYGGVVPEVAAREHVLNILPVINESLTKAGIKPKEAAKKIDAIAVTVGPGLITSLITGIETAKSLAYAWDIPVVGVNHVEGHICANFIASQNKNKTDIKFPALILTVSGGHNMLVLMKGHGKYKILGETRDDAAGEAFDKAAQLLDLGYPGGPIISTEADKIPNSKFPSFAKATEGRQILNKSQKSNSKKTSKICLPRPMLHSKDYDFSFSGLKTALLYEVQKDKNYKNKITEYCHEFQQAVIDVLIHKTIKAAKEYKVKTVMLSGGVSANKELRNQLEQAVKSKLENTNFTMPDLKYTTDNAAMIATAGYFRAKQKKFIPWSKLKVDCNAELK